MLRKIMNQESAPQSPNDQLLAASVAGDLNGVKEALKFGADVNAQADADATYGTKGSTALILCATGREKGHDDVYLHLLGHPEIDLYATNESGEDAGTLALANGLDMRLLAYVAAVKKQVTESMRAKKPAFTGPDYKAL